jgi:hypothetical protein
MQGFVRGIKNVSLFALRKEKIALICMDSAGRGNVCDQLSSLSQPRNGRRQKQWGSTEINSVGCLVACGST